MTNFHHNNRNRRGRKNYNPEERVKKEVREVEKRHDQREARELYRERKEKENRERENKDTRNVRESRDNQVINTFTLGTKELEGKNAQFQYDKGWYSIIDIVGEEKNMIYKSKNAQEAYMKWNVYIGRKKERPQRAEKAE